MARGWAAEAAAWKEFQAEAGASIRAGRGVTDLRHPGSRLSHRQSAWRYARDQLGRGVREPECYAKRWE